MRLVVDASTLVAEALRKRGRTLLRNPTLDLVAASEALTETEHELRKRVALIAERGHLGAEMAERLLDAALSTIAARVVVAEPEVYVIQLDEARRRVPRDARDAPDRGSRDDPRLRHLDSRSGLLRVRRPHLDDRVAAHPSGGAKRWVRSRARMTRNAV